MGDMEFAKTILSRDPNLNEPMMDDCMRHGIMYGCNKTCPVLLAGECDLMYDENKELYDEAMEESK